MVLARLLHTQAQRPHRNTVESALDRELKDHPGRSYGEIIARLRGDSGSLTNGSNSRAQLDDRSPQTPEPTEPLEGAEAAPATEAPQDDATAGVVEASSPKPRHHGGGGGGRQDKKKKEKKVPQPLKVEAKFTAAQQISGGLNPGPSAFGLMEPKYEIRGLSHEVKANKVVVTGTLHCRHKWGVHSLGNKDVPSGTAKFITANNFNDIADDIDPDKGTHANAAPYKQYWSKAATKAHELDHVADDWAWSQVHGVAEAKKHFENNAVQSDKVNQALRSLSKSAPADVLAGSDLHYGANLAYYSRPGEIRAHAVGATVERPLAAAVRSHGQDLKKAADAKKAAKDAKKAVKKEGKAKSAPEAAMASRSEGAHAKSRSAEYDRTVDAVMRMFQ